MQQAPRAHVRRRGSCRCRRTGARRPAADWSPAASAWPGRARRGCWCRRRSSRSRSCRPCASRRSPSSSEREARRPADVLRGDLIDRDAVLDVGAGGLPRVHAGQVRRGRARVVAGAVAERVAVLVRQAESTSMSSRNGSSGFRMRVQLEAGPSAAGVQSAIVDAVGHVGEGEPQSDAACGGGRGRRSAGVIASSTGSAMARPCPSGTSGAAGVGR